MKKAMQRLFRSKKREAQSRKDSDLGGSEHTANDPKESNKKDITADALLRVDPKTKTMQRLRVRVLHEPSKSTTAVVE